MNRLVLCSAVFAAAAATADPLTVKSANGGRAVVTYQPSDMADVVRICAQWTERAECRVVLVARGDDRAVVEVFDRPEGQRLRYVQASSLWATEHRTAVPQ